MSSPVLKREKVGELDNNGVCSHEVCDKSKVKVETESSQRESSDNLIETNALRAEETSGSRALEPPDGGWGWMVLVGCFFTLLLTHLPLSCFGVIFVPLFQEQKVSSTNIAWIFNVHAFIWNINVMIVGPFCEEYGWRTVAIVGGFINSLSLILSGFVPRYELLFFTYSTLGAIGGSIGATVCFFVISKYFVKRRGFALGIMTLGVCAGSFISPLLSNFLLDKYSFQGAALIFGGLLLHQSVAGALFHPVKWHMKRPLDSTATNGQRLTVSTEEIGELSNDATEFEAAKLKAKKLRREKLQSISECSQFSVGSFGNSSPDLVASTRGPRIKKPTEPSKTHPFRRILTTTYSNLKQLGSTRVCFVAMASAGMMMGNVNFQMWIPFAVRDAGHSLEMSAWALSIAAITNTCARIITSSLSDWSRFDVIKVNMAGLLLMGLSIVAFTLYANLYYTFACVAIWGWSMGMSMSLFATAMITTMGLELFPAVYGISALFIALTFVSVGPLVGFIRDTTSSYRITFLVIAGMVFVSFLLWLAMPLCKKYDLKKDSKRKRDKV